MWLFSGEERQARIAFIGVPAGLVRVTLPETPECSLMWGGTGAHSGEIVTHGGGFRRIDGLATGALCGFWRMAWAPLATPRHLPERRSSG
jgi:hypothetical protein